MVKIFCKLCLQPVAATEWKSHITQKRHLQELPAKIVVKGPFKQDEIHKVFEYFVKFGGVRGQNVTTNGLEVSIEYRFWNARDYSEIIHQEHALFDNELEISWFKKAKSGNLEHVLPDERMRKEKFVYRKIAILNSLNELSNFDEQLTLLLNKVKIPRPDLDSFKKIIYDHLTAALVSHFPHSMIHFFGSRVTDLDIHDSDLNIYLDNTDSQLATLECIKELIERSEFFERVSLCLDGDSPVVKFEHKKTKIFCQVSIKNELPVGNTELIKFYLMLDEKLKPLIVLIKFWLDCCGLRHENGLSSYAICLMVLFYLQQDPYNLPSVADLQTDLPPDEVDGWNCAFGPVEFTSSSLENATIFELMVGFLEFYSKFDYASTVLSPYWGSAIEKIGFLKPYELPDCFENFVNSDKVFVVNSGICVQDVFEHSKNVSLSVDLSSVARFTAVCRKSLELARSNAKGILFKLLASDEDLNEFSVINDDFCDEHEWIGVIKSLVSTILTRICRCDIVEKIEETGVCYDCSGDFNVWDDRVQTLKNLPVDRKMNTVEREVAVSSHIVNNSSKEATWKMAVSLKFDTNPSRVSISFKDEENLPLILDIQHFVYVRLLEMLNRKLEICVDDSDVEMPLAKDDPIDKVDQDDETIKNSEQSEDKGEEKIKTVNQETQSSIDLNKPDNDSDTEMISNTSQTIKVDIDEESSTQDTAITLSTTSLSVKTNEHEPGIQDGATFENQAAIFEKNLDVQRAQILSNHNRVIADLSTLLKTDFPKLVFDFSETSITGYNCLMQIYVDGVNIETVERLIRGSDKFTQLSRPSVFDYVIHGEHVATHTNFALNLNDNSALLTSRLITQYMSSDPRISSLLTIIKFWDDLFEDRFTNNLTIPLMAIFYLQIVHKFPDVHTSPVLTFSNDLKDLVVGFFRFYDSFDYVNYVISPYFASLVQKTRLLKPYDLSDRQYVDQSVDFSISSSIDVQDPFQLYKNLTIDVTLCSLGAFTRRVRHTLLSLQETQSLSVLVTRRETFPGISHTLEKKDTQDAQTWLHSIKVVLTKLLKDVVDCSSLSEYETGALVTWVCKGERNVFQHRTHAAKRLILPSGITDLDREIGVTRAVNAQFSQSMTPWELELELSVDNSNLVTLCVKKGPPVPGINFIGHFLYVHLMKALDGDLDVKRHLQQVTDHPTTDILANSLQAVSSVATQATSIRTTCYINKVKFAQNRATIESDLKSALATFTPKKVVFNFRLLSSENLGIYIETEHPLPKIHHLISNSHLFSEICVTTDFIRCTHVETNLTCDLNTTDRLSEARNNLLKYYLDLDDNVSSLMYFVRFWVDHNRLTGIQGFSSNAIYIMVIFFLQRRYKLPSVKELQVGVPPNDGCAFKQVKFTSLELRNVSMCSLVLQFFDFYGSFDYISLIISPYLGHPIEKTLSVGSGFCVYDFFSRVNVCSADLYLCGKFATLCRISSQLIVESEENFFQCYIIDQRTSFSVRSDINDVSESVYFVEQIFTKVFGCSMVVCDRTDTSTRYRCGVTHDVWTRRMQCRKSVTEAPDAFNRECAVTADVVTKFPQKSCGSFFLKIKTSQKSIEIRLTMINDFPLIFHMCHFLYVTFYKPPGPDVARSLEIANKTSWEKTNPSDSNLSFIIQLSEKNPRTFASQLSFFYSTFCTSNTALQVKINRIAADLRSILNHNNILFYGSCLLGVHTPNSDINIQVCNTSLETIEQLLLGSNDFTDVIMRQHDYIKCVHNHTKQSLTFATRDEIALATHELLSCYLSGCDDFCVLVSVIKHWARCCNVIKSITGHLITLLVIFYMQVEHKLPCVADHQKSIPTIFRHNWNTAISRYKGFYLNSFPKVAILDLVKGFFKFYESFDYFSYVVAPFCGTPIAKIRFLQPFAVPEQYELYKNQDRELEVDTGMCIQCPFEHTRNLSTSVRYSTAATFATLCRHALCRLQQNEKKMLYDVLMFNNVQNVKFSLPRPAQVNRDAWLDSVKTVTVRILTDLLGGKIVQETVVGSATTRYKCQGVVSVLENRAAILKKISAECSGKSLIDQESAVSSHILQRSDAKEQKSWGIGVQIVATKTYPVKVSVYFSGPLQMTVCHFVYTRLLKFLNGDQDAVLKRKNEDFSTTSSPKRSKVCVASTISSEKQSTSSFSQEKAAADSSLEGTEELERSCEDDTTKIQNSVSGSPEKNETKSADTKSPHVSSESSTEELPNSVSVPTESSVESAVSCDNQTTYDSSEHSGTEELKHTLEDSSIVTSSSPKSDQKPQDVDASNSSSEEIDRASVVSSQTTEESVVVKSVASFENQGSATSENNSPVLPSDDTNFLINSSSSNEADIDSVSSVSKNEEVFQDEVESNSSTEKQADVSVISSETGEGVTDSLSVSSVEEIGAVIEVEMSTTLATTVSSNQADIVLSSSSSDTTPCEDKDEIEEVESKDVEVRTSEETGLSSSSSDTQPCEDEVKPTTTDSRPVSSESQIESTSVVKEDIVQEANSSNATISNQQSKQVAPNPTFVPEEAKLAVLKETQNQPTFAAQTSHFCTKLLVGEATIQANQIAIKHDLNTAMGGVSLDRIDFFGPSSTFMSVEGSHYYVNVNLPRPRDFKPPKHQLLKYYILRSGKFCEILASPTQSVVKCKHKETNVECVIHTDNELSVFNGRLIKYYVSLDPKLRQLFFVITCWWKFNDVEERTSFSIYAIYLMIIFYLQQEPLKLPSVSRLQQNACPVYRQTWNVAFIPSRFPNQALKAATIKDLVFGFFKFYATFDFYSYVVAPFVGLAVDKVNFLKPFRLPVCYKSFVKLGASLTFGMGAWIQDPFEHTRNVTDSDNIVYVDRFTSLCRVALVGSSGENELLYRLMSPGVKIDHGVEIEKDETWEEQKWMQKVKNVLLSILKKILYCEVVLIDQKKMNVDGGTKGVFERTVVTCKGTKEVWNGRVNIAKLYETHIPLGTNCYTSDKFVSKIIMKDCQRVSTFGLSVEMLFTRNPTTVKITVLEEQLSHLTHFLYTRMLAVLETSQVDRQIWSPLQFRIETKSPPSAICEPYKILVKDNINYAMMLQMHDYFSNFGKIVEVKVLGEDTKLALEYCFADRDVYLLVIQSEHLFLKNKLKIIPLAPLKTTIPNAKFKDRRLEIVHGVAKFTTFQQQVDDLLCQVNSYKEKAEQKYKLILNNFGTTLSGKFTCSDVVGTNLAAVDVSTDFVEVYVEPVTKPESLKDLIDASGSFYSVSLTSDTLITCKHVKTELKCHLRVNKLTMKRRLLIQYYLSLDAKIPKFVTLVKFWVDYYDLVDAFTDSAMYLMAIFYLQQQPYNLPCVKNLQDGVTPEVTEGWNCAYAEVPEFTNPALESATILDLLSGFFKFYANFDYVTNLISPYFGSPIPKTSFLKPFTLPDGFEQFQTLRKNLDANSGVFVQDFFDHRRNLASSASLNCMGGFTNLCRTSLQLINSDENFLLYKLLINVQRHIFEYPEFVINKNDERSEQGWFQGVKTMTVKILTDVLDYKLSKAVFGGEVVSFEFVGQHNVWNDRVKAMKKRSGRRGVDREVAISSRVVRDAPEKINWKLFLDLFFLKDPCRVKVIFRQKPGCFNVFHVCHFLYTKLVMFLEEIKDDPEEIGEVSGVDDSDKKLVPEEEEDDDVPSDFFDDFANEDFLDGLNILDDKVAEVAKITKPDYHKENESNNKKVLKSSDKERSSTENESKDKKMLKSGKQHKERSSVKDGCDDDRILQPGHALRERLRLRDERRERARSRIRLKSKSRFESRDRSKISSNSTVRKYITTTSRIVIKTRVRSRTPSPCRSKREKRSRSRECRSRRLPHRFTTRNRTRSPSPYSSKRRKRSRSPDYRSRRRSLSRGSNKSPTRRVLPQNSLLEEIKKKINEVKPRIALPRVQPVPMTRVPLIPNPRPLYNENFVVATPVPYQQRVLAPIPLIPLPETTPSAETTQRDTSANHSVFAHLQKKAKVLRRCHDLTQFLNHNPRPTCLTKSLPKLSTSPRYQSPVKTALDLSFKFTSPPEQPVKDTYAEALHKVVEQAGMVKEVGVKRDKVVDKVTEVLETLKKALSDAVQKE